MSVAFLTGVTGFVGSWLAEYILKNQPEWEVLGLKRWRSPLDNILHLIQNPRLKLVDGDLRDPISIRSIISDAMPDRVFHLAAQSFVPDSYSAPVNTIETNVLGTLNLLDALIELPETRILICSSSEVYGNASIIPTPETCPPAPISPYAVSKLAEDYLGFMYHRAYQVSAIRTRAFTHTGPRQHEVFFIPSIAKQIAEAEISVGKPIIMLGNPASVRTICDVRDMVRAYWLVLEKGIAGEVYNIGGTERASVRQVAEMMIGMSTIPKTQWVISENKNLLRPADVEMQYPLTSKFAAICDWKPEIPLHQALEDTLNYWRGKVSSS